MADEQTSTTLATGHRVELPVELAGRLLGGVFALLQPRLERLLPDGLTPVRVIPGSRRRSQWRASPPAAPVSTG
ncbi:MAG: hypothetical protein ABEJ63_05985 [Halosegnis sp.]